MADYGTYCDLASLKARLGISGVADDAQMLRILTAASRRVDGHCRRHFYAKTQTRYFDGIAGSGQVIDQYTERLTWYLNKLWIDDLLSVTTIKLDYDGDATYEYTLVATDYILYPYADFPKVRVDLDLRQGDYYNWPRGQRAIEIAGLWGYGNASAEGRGGSATPYADSGTTTNEALDASETGVDVVSGVAIEPGNTMLVESEQMYVQSVSSNTLTVVRGVNGTTAATHATAKTVYVYQYPDEIIEAVLMTAARLWKRRDSSFATVIGGPEIGPVEVHRGLDTDVKEFLKGFVRQGSGYLGAIA